MSIVRPPAVAGMFYPGNRGELETTVRRCLDAIEPTSEPIPKAIVAPHAGYVYSGEIAATAYARLRPARERIHRVILLGPCHRVPVRGLALPDADAFATPLGEVPVDREAARLIADLPQVSVYDATHRQEHSLEVQLPFLQTVLDRFSIVPLVVGQANDDEVAEVLERLWGGPETLIIVSSDLSHYYDYDTANRLDHATCQAIEEMAPERLGDDQACGRIPLKGLLTSARRRGLRVHTVDLRNSGDTAGPRDQVVGYGAWVFIEPDTEILMDAVGKAAAAAPFEDLSRTLLERYGRTLLHLAITSIEHGIAEGQPLPVSPGDFPPPLRQWGACFVTLHVDGELRGCVGSPHPHVPLVIDVAENAFAAAFRDTRFPPLSEEDLPGLDVSLSILSEALPVTFADEEDLLRQLRPQIDGLIIADGPNRALFLPSVWESLPEPKTFLGRLKRKAGLAPDHWSPTFKAWRFVTRSIASGQLGDTACGKNHTVH